MATALHFTKGHGTGNDFVLYSDPEGERPLSPAKLRVCAIVTSASGLTA